MNHDSKRPVTLEDIIRLKRAERPPVEFWTQFDRELRAKQLSALVEKRPWWRTISFPQVFVGVRRYHLPLGAAAVLAVTVFSVREYNTPAAAPAVVAQVAVTAAPSAALAAAPVAVMLATAAETASAPAGWPAATVSGGNQSASSQFVLSSDATPSGSLAQIIPVVGAASNSDDPAAAAFPGARLIAENFATLHVAEPTLSRQMLTPPRGFETRVLPSRPKPVEPLAQMRVPSGSRRSNVIASATLASTTTPVVANDHSARALSDERLYETASRVNAHGAGMLVKF